MSMQLHAVDSSLRSSVCRGAECASQFIEPRDGKIYPWRITIRRFDRCCRRRRRNDGRPGKRPIPGMKKLCEDGGSVAMSSIRELLVSRNDLITDVLNTSRPGLGCGCADDVKPYAAFCAFFEISNQFVARQPLVDEPPGMMAADCDAIAQPYRTQFEWFKQ